MRMLITDSQLDAATDPAERLTAPIAGTPRGVIAVQRWQCSVCAHRVVTEFICASGRCAACEARHQLARMDDLNRRSREAAQDRLLVLDELMGASPAQRAALHERLEASFAADRSAGDLFRAAQRCFLAAQDLAAQRRKAGLL